MVHGGYMVTVEVIMRRIMVRRGMSVISGDPVSQDARGPEPNTYKDDAVETLLEPRHSIILLHLMC